MAVVVRGVEIGFLELEVVVRKPRLGGVNALVGLARRGAQAEELGREEAAALALERGVGFAVFAPEEGTQVGADEGAFFFAENQADDYNDDEEEDEKRGDAAGVFDKQAVPVVAVQRIMLPWQVGAAGILEVLGYAGGVGAEADSEGFLVWRRHF